MGSKLSSPNRLLHTEIVMLIDLFRRTFVSVLGIWAGAASGAFHAADTLVKRREDYEKTGHRDTFGEAFARQEQERAEHNRDRDKSR